MARDFSKTQYHIITHTAAKSDLGNGDISLIAVSVATPIPFTRKVEPIPFHKDVMPYNDIHISITDGIIHNTNLMALNVEHWLHKSERGEMIPRICSWVDLTLSP